MADDAPQLWDAFSNTVNPFLYAQQIHHLDVVDNFVDSMNTDERNSASTEASSSHARAVDATDASC